MKKIIADASAYQRTIFLPTLEGIELILKI